MTKQTFLIFMTICALMLTGCDKLDDGDASLVREVLPGTWAFSYELQSEEEVGIEVDYEYVIFRDDNTVSITYPEGSLEGTYEAGSVAIRIDGAVDGGSQQQMLWRIITFSKKKITAEYKFDWQDQAVTAIVTLEKV